MKHFFVLLLLVVICNSCSFVDKGEKPGHKPLFKITRDTALVDYNGRISHAILIKNKYYCFFEERNPVSTARIKKFYIVSLTGNLIKEINVPSAINDEFYYNFKLKGDSIIVTTELSKKTFYLDQKKQQFEEVAYQEGFDFEDKNYHITALCKGEWGSMIYFENKNSKVTYAASLGCPIMVSKIGNSYVVNAEGVFQINDPSKLKQVSDRSFNEAPPYQESEGIRILYRQRDLINPDSTILTSFVTDEKLFHFCTIRDGDEAYSDIFSKKEKVIPIKTKVQIGLLENMKFKSLYTFPEKFDIEFQQLMDVDYQFHLFHTERRVEIGFHADKPVYREAKYGFIEIKGNEVKTHYFISKKAN